MAGAITAGTRARLVHAGLKAPRDIVTLATDGVISRVPLDIESDGKILGEWEGDNIDHAVFVKRGNYAIESGGEETIYKGKSRGVNIETILGTFDDSAKKDQAWFDYLDRRCLSAWSPRTRDHDIQGIKMPHTKLLTFGAATVTPMKWERCGNWIDTTRFIDTNDAGCKRLKCTATKRAFKLVPTVAACVANPDKLSKAHTTDWIISPDEDTLEWREAAEEEAIGFGRGFSANDF
jgi:hypothetical protein